MGLRGPGSARQRRAIEEADKVERDLPWEADGLSRAEKVIAFLEFLPITKGHLVGSNMRLLPEQRVFVQTVYGDLDAVGKRRVKIAIQSEPRGNGKTGLLAGLSLCHLLGPESMRRGEIYSASFDKGMAAKIYAEMEAIIYQVYEFNKATNCVRFHKKIEVLDGKSVGSVYEALSSDSRRGHGLAPSLWIYDELAQTADRALLDNLLTAMGKQPEALGIIISTQAPDDAHALSQLIDDGLTGADDSTYVQLISAPEGADIYDEAVQRACNPAWGIFLDIDDLRKAADRAKRIPGFESAFRNRHLNQRIDSSVENRVVTLDVWKGGAENKVGNLEDYRGRDCFAGLDLSGKHDLTALICTFPDEAKSKAGEPEPHFDIVPFFWTPEGAMAARRPPEQQLFRLWMSQGFLTPVPGPVIQYGYVARQLIEVRKCVKRLVLGYDRWRIDDLKQELDALGQAVVTLGEDKEPYDEEAIIFIPVGQGFKDQSPAIDIFSELALTGRLNHGGHPVLTASVSNAITVPDPAGNLKFNKAKGNRRGSVRIDGAVATAMGLIVSKRFAEAGVDTGASAYEDPDYPI